MKGLRRIWWGLCVILILCSSVSMGFSATVPSVLNYQGTLNDSSGNPVTGQHEMTFRLYNDLLGGTAFWNETQTVAFDTTGHFSVTLGSINPIDKNNFTGQTYIGIQVGSDPELAPRQQLTSVAYALKAADAIPAGAIIMWSGAIDAIPTGWALCDGNNGTPDLRDRFVVGAGTSYTVSAMGGTNTVNLSHSHTVDSHHHYLSLNTNSAGNHSHTYSGTTSIEDDEATMDNGNGHHVADNGHHHTFSGTTSTSGNHVHSVSGNTGSASPGTDSKLSPTTENRPPYYALAFIMKL